MDVARLQRERPGRSKPTRGEEIDELVMRLVDPGQ
jgi:hypothetical protein